MSNYLAIATVTSVLRKRLQEIVSVSNIGNSTVEIGRPQPQSSTQQSRVGLYLYQTTPNSSWHDGGLPSRNPSGRLRQTPTIALDLYYLITFYGVDIGPHLLLGRVVSSLHARPMLTPLEINQQISQSNSALATSDLASQPDRIRLSPTSFSLEDMANLWSLIGVPYELSIAYVASNVLIAAEDGLLEGLPVSQQVHS